MALKPQIFCDVPAIDIPKRVSGEFKKLAEAARLNGGLYTVVSFLGMKGSSASVVDSKTLTKYLDKCPATNKIIVVAHDFTSEARAIMEKKKIVPIYERDFGWTDEGWAYIRDNY